MKQNVFQAYRIKLLSLIGCVAYAIAFACIFKIDPYLVNNLSSTVLFMASLVSMIYLILDLPTSNPKSKYTPEDLFRFERDSTFTVPKLVAERIFKDQGFIYQWQIDEHSISKEKYKAAKHYGLLS